ncbi:hypothetical protein [Rhizohabitans arisaemae]|uniref:hypothetical protein n=1 Tax=Rhizohabitans arisaemae TaxID=2720610 RepID=UPI0024B09641|nr:hypothetical protein [Rhizohabitans arisaemae]
MATQLLFGDPLRVGPFHLRARLVSGPSGIVFLGRAPDGRDVSVALLTVGAAADPAARDRFSAAIRTGAGVAGTPPAVVAAAAGAESPWVATPFVPGLRGAESFLEPVLVSGVLTGRVQGPDFRPYWIDDRDPAVPRPVPVPPPPPETASKRSVLAASLAVGALTLMLSLMVWLLFGPVEEVRRPQPLPPTLFVPTPPPVPSVSPSPEPSEGPTGPARPTPTPEETGGDDGGDPI